MEVQTPFVRCRLCDAFISILEAAGGERQQEAPDAFIARCPGCNAQALYTLSDINYLDQGAAF